MFPPEIWHIIDSFLTSRLSLLLINKSVCKYLNPFVDSSTPYWINIIFSSKNKNYIRCYKLMKKCTLTPSVLYLKVSGVIGDKHIAHFLLNTLLQLLQDKPLKTFIFEPVFCSKCANKHGNEIFCNQNQVLLIDYLQRNTVKRYSVTYSWDLKYLQNENFKLQQHKCDQCKLNK